MTAMTNAAPLLIELGCEEIPPKDLAKLATSFADSIAHQLQAAGLAPGGRRDFATPRRLAVTFDQVLSEAPTTTDTKRGPAIKSAFDTEGNPTKAAQGFARSLGVDVADLATIETDKGPCLGMEVTIPGSQLDDVLPDIIETAMKQLPVSKRMRWGEGEHEFVRPVHWLIILHGDRMIPATILGIDSRRESHGHRIHHPEPVVIGSPTTYVDDLHAASVMVDMAARRSTIQSQLNAITNALGAQPIDNPGLLDEVNGLVEWPVALHGRFDEKYLAIPHEVLTISMESHQRYFSLRDAKTGDYLNRFITVANLESANPAVVIEGNERVIEPRFADAEFFWQKDQQKPLASYRAQLDNVIFHKDIGSQGERVERIIQLSVYLAEQCQADIEATRRIAALAKCDLLTDMVQEFPELQGSMGKYYAQAQGESEVVSQGIESHYAPRFSGDALPASREASAVAIAEKMDTIASLFSIAQYPTGSKDPYALRRAALGVIRMLVALAAPFTLEHLITQAISTLPERLTADPSAREVMADKMLAFMVERYRHFAQQTYTPEQLNAVLSARENMHLSDVDHRLAVLNRVANQEPLGVIAAAAKRSRNLLTEHSAATIIDPRLLSTNSEQALEQALSEAMAKLDGSDDYAAKLAILASLAPVLDQFFEDTMVMDEDRAIRENRLALLRQFVDMAEADYHLSELSA